MNITITLTEAQVSGIKNYLREVGNIKNPKKSDIQDEIQNLVSGNLQSPREAIAMYIEAHETGKRVY